MQSPPSGRTPFLDRRLPLGMSWALAILVLFFFLLPFAFQSARLSLATKENDVKDWLPSDFRETAELSWFADHFVGESFVLATWPGCTTDDQRLQLLEAKLRHESLGYRWDDDKGRQLTAQQIASRKRARELGNEMQLLFPGESMNNWGGRREKWLQSAAGEWFFLTPDGHLSRWTGSVNGPAGLARAIKRATGSFKLEGQFITAVGEPSSDTHINAFYNDPTLLCAPLFSSVQTGNSIVDELAREGGPLWPTMTAPEAREMIARRSAMARLTGSLFAPAAPDDFEWTADAFAQVILENDDAIQSTVDLPPDFAAIVDAELTEFLSESNVADLKEATVDVQAEAWYAVFDELDLPAPSRQTAIIITLTDVAKNNLAFAIGRGVLGGPRGRLLALAEESGLTAASPPSMAPPPFNRIASDASSGLPPLRMGGPPVDNIAIDEEGTVTLVRLVGYSVLVGVFLSYLCFRSVKITLTVFVVGGSAAMLSMACVGWSSGRVDAILMSMPSLVYVLGLSGAIHVVNYYRDEVRSRGLEGAAGRALRHAIVPCTLASTTTAIGLASLYTSNLAPISNFGIYSAVGVVATLAILFSYLPAALSVFQPNLGKDAEQGGDSDPKNSQFSEWWASVGRAITNHHVPVSIACTVVMIAVAVGIFKVETSVQLLKLFDPASRIIDDYGWIEDNFGKLVPMELAVRMPPGIMAENIPDPEPPAVVDESLSTLREEEPPSPEEIARRSREATSLELIERVEAVSRIRMVVQHVLGETGADIVGQASSLGTFLPDIPAASNDNTFARATRYRILNELPQSYDELITSDYLRLEKEGPYQGSELWRISLRVGALTDVDYGQFIGSLRQTVEPVLRAYETRAAIMKSLSDQANTQPKLASRSNSKRKKKSKPRLLMLGSEQPEPLATANLSADVADADTDAKLVNAENVYLSTLHDLLEDEEVRVAWLDPTSETGITKFESSKWDKTIETLDMVVLTSANIPAEKLTSAKSIVDGNQIFASSPEPTLQDGYPSIEGGGEIQAVYTGVVPVVYKAQRTLLASLGESIGLAFVLIAAVMIVLLNPGRRIFDRFRPTNFANGFAAGWVSMIPNVFPVLIVFGAMGHLNQIWPGGFLVDIGTMMTASVAMGVAVDDTIHFLSWFRSYLDLGYSRRDAVIETYRRVGPAMTQTTVVGGLGLFVFALSTFTPTQRFGTLMLVLLATALVGDLVFLPAILVGPLGKFFKPRDTDRKQPTASDSGKSSDDVSQFDGPSTTDAQYADDQGSEPTQVLVDSGDLPRLKLHVPPESAPRRNADQRR